MNRPHFQRVVLLAVYSSVLIIATSFCSGPKPMNNLGILKKEYLDGLF
jgi:hypothetical protein